MKSFNIYPRPRLASITRNEYVLSYNLYLEDLPEIKSGDSCLSGCVLIEARVIRLMDDDDERLGLFERITLRPGHWVYVCTCTDLTESRWIF